jgi:hypothetical protein
LNPPEIDILHGKLVGAGNEEEQYGILKAVRNRHVERLGHNWDGSALCIPNQFDAF